MKILSFKNIFMLINFCFLFVGLVGCGSNDIDGLLDDYEKLCSKSSSLQKKLQANDISALKEFEGMARDMQAINSKLEMLKEKGFSKSQNERFLKIMGKCAGL